MADLKPTPQRVEIYAQARIEGLDQSKSLVRAHPRAKRWTDATVHTTASLFEQKVEVKKRIAELRAEHAERHNITVEKLTQMLTDTYADAKRDKNHSAQVSAVAAMTKLHGLGLERSEQTTHHKYDALEKEMDTMTTEQIRAMRALVSEGWKIEKAIEQAKKPLTKSQI